MDNLWIWLVVSTSLKKYESIGMIIPNMWKNIKMFLTTNQLVMANGYLLLTWVQQLQYLQWTLL